MTSIMFLFWVSVVALVYHYVGYPVLLFVLATCVQIRRDIHFFIFRLNRRCTKPKYLPNVAVIFSAFNEQEVIADKLKNTRLLDYPAERLQVLLGIDAATDSTAALARKGSFPSLQIFEFPARRGKLAVLRDLIQRTSSEVIVFTDANTMLQPNCIRMLVRHFSDPRVGAVSGEEVRCGSDACSGESAYWRYESAVKLLESRLNCSMGANGALYAVRRELFNASREPFAEDFQIPLDIRFSGHRVVYDPECVAEEDIPSTIEAQFQRRVRISFGNYQAMFRNPGYLNPLRGAPAFAFFSHRFLRWMSPFLLSLALVTNSVLASDRAYAALLGCQIFFYLMATIGYAEGGKTSRLFALPMSFCLMNVAFVFGLARYLMGRQPLAWKVTPRQGLTISAR